MKGRRWMCKKVPVEGHVLSTSPRLLYVVCDFLLVEKLRQY
jgi:hypothetical protein